MTRPVVTIRSRDNPLLAQLRRLVRSPAAYRREGLAWIEGEHLCEAYAARGGMATQAVISERGWRDDRLRELAQRAQRLARVDDLLFESISGLESPARLGFLIALPTHDQDVLPDVPTVVLDRLQDAGNVGSILRSASAIGFTQVIALTGTAALWSPKVLRAGMGAHFGLQLVEAALPQVLDRLRIPLLATDLQGDVELDAAQLPFPCCWVLGHEGQGIATELLARCQWRLRIPQPGYGQSLNVAAAAAICLYASLRQRSLRS
jgi:TrmH family RNA methyltransferase